MLTNLNLEIEKIGPVDKVNIGIGKVNVIGGLNATGKSTVSKLLYCILKGNVVNRQKFAYSLIVPSLRRVIRSYRNQIVHGDIYDLSDEELSQFNDLFRNSQFLSDEELVEIYEKIETEIIKENINSDNSWKDEYLLNLNKKIGRQIEVIEKNDNELYSSILKRVLSSEFYSLKFSGLINFRGFYNDQSFDYSIDLRNSLVKDSSLQGFFSLSDVNYIDSISILDLENLDFNNFRRNKLQKDKFRRNKFRRNERITHLLYNLNDDSDSLEFLDEEFNEKIIYVEEKINELINGKFGFTSEGFSFISNDGHETLIGDTSSGIKQIGIVQILLGNRKLKEGSFLIIDEPEVNLHPEWQIKFAELLAKIASDLEVTIYVNTHSPMFIEAMSIFSEYYYLKDETNFYLTKKQGKGFAFKKIANDDMGAVYENLSRPYDDLDKVKADILHRV